MFRIELLVDDKKLPELLRRLTGIALGDPKIQPMINVEKTKKGKPRALSNGSIVETLRQRIEQDKPEEVTVDYIKKFLEASGRSASSYSYAMSEAFKAGVLRKTGKGKDVKYLPR